MLDPQYLRIFEIKQVVKIDNCTCSRGSLSPELVATEEEAHHTVECTSAPFQRLVEKVARLQAK